VGLDGLLRKQLYFFYTLIFVPHRKRTYGPPQLVTGITLLFLYVYDGRTSQETHVRASTACYGDNFTFSICS
jgi:hypothetical protein